MKYLLSLLFLIGCNYYDPKVGDCYERYDNDMKYDTHEYNKIIKVEGDDLQYIYNFINAENFEKGKWYISPVTETAISLYFETYNNVTHRKIQCPW